MGVDFCGKNAFVAKQLLNHTQVSTVLNQMGGEGVAKGMWTDILRNPGQFGQSFYELKNTHSAEGTSS